MSAQEVERYSLPLTFFVGFLLGRTIWSKVERVEPRIVYIPPSQVNANIVGDPQLAQAIRELQEVPAVKKYVEALGEREKALLMLRLANKALEEGRISAHTFQALTRKYLYRLVEVEREIERLKPEIENIANVFKHKIEMLLIKKP